MIASQLDAPSLSMVRTVFWCGLREKQRDMTVEDAGRLIHAIGFAEAGDLIGKAFKLTFPEAPAKAARPPKAGRTTKAG